MGTRLIPRGASDNPLTLLKNFSSSALFKKIPADSSNAIPLYPVSKERLRCTLDGKKAAKWKA